MSRNRKIIAVLAAIVVLIQFIPINGRQEIQPASANDLLNVLPADNNTAMLLRQACYDCHSNEVNYPWYANLAPLSWWIQHHINEGRHEANFSEFGELSIHDRDKVLHECAEMLTEDEMPLKSYRWVHSEAKLTSEDKDALITFFEENRAGAHR